MNKKLDKKVLENLYLQDKSYKEIAEITGYNRNSVNGYFYRTKGKMEDSRKYRRNSIEISDEQKEIIFGTLLGDGNIQRQKTRSYSGRYNHSIKQEVYCYHILNKLSPLVSEMKYATVIGGNGKQYKTCYFYFKNNLNLEPFHQTFYKNGVKDVPKDLSLLTPLAMAYWFMDDGTASGGCSISIATCSFSLNGLLRLKNYLLERYGIEITIQKDFKIYFKSKSAIIFYELVQEYVIPEMMYKFKSLNIPKNPLI